jgi:hypothetical protein
MNAPARRGKIGGIGPATLAWTCALTAVLMSFHSGMLAQAETKVKPSKHALTAQSMEGLHKLIRLQPGEYRWDEIPWYASIWHARKAAAEQDKPIFVFGTGGAGFNDPLGNC